VPPGGGEQAAADQATARAEAEEVGADVLVLEAARAARVRAARQRARGATT
jgi:hypothetical protein